MFIHKHTSFEQKGLRGKMQISTEDLSEEKKAKISFEGARAGGGRRMGMSNGTSNGPIRP